MMHAINRDRSETKTARINVISALFLLLAGIIIFRLFVLQIVKHSFFERLATGQHGILEELTPSRGIIYAKDKDNNLFAVAENKEKYLLYAVPSMIESASTTLERISEQIELSDEEKEKMLQQLNKSKDPYEPLKHELHEEEKNKIENLKIQGIHFQPEKKRFYAEGSTFSHLTGFLGFKEDKRVGQYGLEEYLEQELKGEAGILKSERDPAGRLIGVGNFDIESAKDGANVYLTIDRLVQFKVCEILKSSVEKYGASAGTIIVQNTNTGEILSMCSEPSFDPNNYSGVESINVYPNPALSEVYEPGSIFKAITMAVALDTNSVKPDTTYFDEGILVFGKDTITNAENKKYGEVTMTHVLEESINTGAVFAAQEVGRADMKKYLENFGFGDKTYIDLPGEVYADISALDKKSDIYLATASFGQGISVTPLQMVSAFSAIANGGVLYKPYVVEKVINGENESITYPQEVRRVISSQTSNTLKAMLVAVVKNAHGTMARVDGYNVGGKTGTAQIPGSRGGYINAYNHSFVGFAPVTNTQFTVFVLLKKPTRGLYSATTAAPTFAQVMSFLLNYYEIPTEY
ncbi:MAG: penicillin-binding protein 2 [Patescibacteria group bacterium]